MNDSLLLRQNFKQGDDQTGVECHRCGKSIHGKRIWWEKVSAEYDEWEANCKPCAIAEIHKYDDCDEDE